jgi:chemotaxis protein MotB
MSAHGRKRRRGPAVEHENEERWLLTYADMITLLMALFMVLFSIASINKAKLQVLTKTLQEAFSGKILPGGTNLQQSGSEPNAHAQPTATPPIPAIQPLIGSTTATSASQSQSSAASSAAREQQNFQHLKAQIDSYAAKHGLRSQLETTVTRRGLVIRLLTDKVLFDSGSATLKPPAGPELAQISGLLRSDNHDIMVEGNTDNLPIHGSVFPTNWELSTARASRVVRQLIQDGVGKGRLGAAGYAALHPIATNATAVGRSRNRRVEIVLLRNGQGPATQGGGSP